MKGKPQPDTDLSGRRSRRHLDRAMGATSVGVQCGERSTTMIRHCLQHRHIKYPTSPNRPRARHPVRTRCDVLAGHSQRFRIHRGLSPMTETVSDIMIRRRDKLPTWNPSGLWTPTAITSTAMVVVGELRYDRATSLPNSVLPLDSGKKPSTAPGVIPRQPALAI